MISNCSLPNPFKPLILGIVALLVSHHGALAQTATPATRTEAIEDAQAEKVKELTPQEPQKGERLTARVEAALTRGGPHWYPFFESSYPGGGFPVGAGYSWFVSAYNTVDVRGSITPSGYKRMEAEFLAPTIFNRRGTLDVIGGWREATQVPFYGLGASQAENRVSYGFKQPHASALLTLRPTRRLLVLNGGIEYIQWNMQPGQGSFPSIEEVFPRESLVGVDAPWRLLRDHVSRLRRPGRSVRFPRGPVRSRSTHSDPARSMGLVVPWSSDHVPGRR
jgi:hypothetical protein